MTPRHWKDLHQGNDYDCLKDINPKAQLGDVVFSTNEEYFKSGLKEIQTTIEKHRPLG